MEAEWWKTLGLGWVGGCGWGKGFGWRMFGVGWRLVGCRVLGCRVLGWG